MSMQAGKVSFLPTQRNVNSTLQVFHFFPGWVPFFIQFAALDGFFPVSAAAVKLDRGFFQRPSYVRPEVVSTRAPQSAGQQERTRGTTLAGVPEVIRDSTHHHVAPDLAKGADEVSVVVVVHLSQRRRHAGHEAALQEGRDAALVTHHHHKAAAAAASLNLRLPASLSTDTTDTDLIWQSLRSERQLRGIWLERDGERKAEGSLKQLRSKLVLMSRKHHELACRPNVLMKCHFQKPRFHGSRTFFFFFF